jgi:hypothetical protein
MDLFIRVTDADIRNGDAYSPLTCPIALAARRNFPAGTKVFVGGDLMEVALPVAFGQPENVTRFRMPAVAVTFQRAFDRHQPVRPVAFLALREGM